MKKKILWHSTAPTANEGYGYAAEKLSSNLRKFGCPLFVNRDLPKEPGKTVTQGVNITLEDGLFLVDETDYNFDIVINNCLPDSYRGDGKYRIGFTYWETETIPKNWVMPMKYVNEIWTTSQWAVEVFGKSLPESKIVNFKLGVDPVFNYTNGPQKGPFTFMHIGSPSSRKNTQMAVDCFLKVFGGDRDYRLIIKSNGPPDARWRTESGENLGAIGKHPQIKVIDEIVSEAELSKIYEMAHCFVYPTSGEGWGMLPFQALAKGIPTICTNASACKEFAYLSIPLDYQIVPTRMAGIYSRSTWAMPKVDDLCDKMLYVVRNYDFEKDKAHEASKFLHANYSWENVAKEYYDRLCQI